MTELICSSGKIEAGVGDRFKDHSGEWEIVSFKNETDTIYSPSALGGCSIVVVKPIGDMPTWFRPYENEDGTIDWCADSVAAALLDKQDGKRRSARGSILTTGKST